MALLLMYLKSMSSVLELVRFLKANPDWLVTLNLKRKIHGKLCYKVPDRSTFSKFAKRLGPDRTVEIFSCMVVELLNEDQGNQGRKGVLGRFHHTSMDGSTTANMQTAQGTTTVNAEA